MAFELFLCCLNEAYVHVLIFGEKQCLQILFGGKVISDIATLYNSSFILLNKPDLHKKRFILSDVKNVQ